MTPSTVSGPEPDPSRSPTVGPSAQERAAPDRPDHPPATVAAFSAFYREHAPRLVAFLRWLGAPLADAADCAQEALTECYRRWSTLHEPYAWCRTTASRLYVRRVADPRERPADVLDAPGSPLLAPDTDVDEFESRHVVLALLPALPARQRQVLAWTYDGATTAEIADALRISPDNVRSHLRHARAALRDRRDELGIDR